MHHRTFLTYFFSTFFLLISCTQQSPTVDATIQQKTKALYRKAVQLTFEDPDAALTIIDSVLLLSEQYRLDTFRIVGLARRSLLLGEKREMDDALACAQQAIEMWRPADGIFALCKAQEQMGQCQMIRNNYEEAKYHFKKELELAPQCGEKALGIESFSTGYIADVLKIQGKFKESLQFYDHSNTCAEKFGDRTIIAGNYNNMSGLFSKLGDHNQQLVCLRKAAYNFDSSDYRRAATFLNLANAFINQKQSDSANVYITKAYQMTETPPQIRLISMVGYGSILTEQKHYNAARNLMLQAIALADTISDKERLGIALNQMSETYHAEGNHPKALEYALKADSVFKDKYTIADFSSKFQASKNIVAFHLTANSHSNALKYLDEMSEARDSMNKIEYMEVLASYKTQIKSDSIQLLSAENHLQSATIKSKNLMLLMIGLGSIFLFGLAFFWRQNLLLSKENLGMLESQNQKLQNDNVQLREEIQVIRNDIQLDQSSMLEQRIVLPTRNNLTLRLGDIMYIKAIGGGVHYFTPERKHLVWHGFEESLKMLPQEFFVKIHRSFVVNQAFIEQYSPSKVILKNGEQLPIGITISEDVQKKLSDLTK